MERESRYIELMLPVIISLSLVSCAGSFKAEIDMTASGGIVWPGAPEKPRILYLWALQNLGGERKTYEDNITGSVREDVTDPRLSPILLRPHGIYVDEKRYYISDPGAMRLTVIDRKTLDLFHVFYAREESLEYPISVVSDRNGNIYLSDADLRKVISYDGKGRFRFYFEEDFMRPAGLAIDRDRGLVYVVDSLAHMVFIHDTQGMRIGSIGKRGDDKGEFNYPGYAFVDRNGYLYVSDSLNFRIQIFDRNGDFVTMFGSPGDSYDAFDKPKGVAVDSEGNIYVVDAGKDMIKIFDISGRLLLFFGEKGHGYGQFYLPGGIFIDDEDTIYVADTINMRIQAMKFLGGDS